MPPKPKRTYPPQISHIHTKMSDRHWFRNFGQRTLRNLARLQDAQKIYAAAARDYVRLSALAESDFARKTMLLKAREFQREAASYHEQFVKNAIVYTSGPYTAVTHPDYP